MPENDQFDKLSRELMHVVLQLADIQDGNADYAPDAIRQVRRQNILILESVLNILKILFRRG